MAGSYASSDDEGEIDMEAERRRQAAMMGAKQQADQLIMAGKFQDAIQMYREILMHLTNSQVKMAMHKDLVVSCRMNVLAGFMKTEQWTKIAPECQLVLDFLEEIQQHQVHSQSSEVDDRQILGRLYYFRGHAQFRLDALEAAERDILKAMQYLPDVDTFRDDLNAIRAALQTESNVKQILAASMQQYKGQNYPQAAETCQQALVEAQKLQSEALQALVHGNLAVIYKEINVDIAIVHYQTAVRIEKDPKKATRNNDRLFDLMDGLAACQARKGDFKGAADVLEELIAIYPRCKQRQSREETFFVAAGQIMFAAERFQQAEKCFVRSQKAGKSTTSSRDAQNLKWWIGRTYLAQKKINQLDQLLGLPEVADDEQEMSDTDDRLAMLWLAMLQEKDELADAEQAHLEKVFQRYRQSGQAKKHCLLRAANALAAISSKNGQAPLQWEEAVTVLETLPVESIGQEEAHDYMQLAIWKVELCLKSGRVAVAKETLKETLVGLRDDKSKLRALLLRRFAELWGIVDQVEPSSLRDEDDRTLLRESLVALRVERHEASTKALLASTLLRLAEYTADREGDVKQAEDMLEEVLTLLRGTEDKEHLCEALVGMCVLQVKQGNAERARALLSEVEAFAGDDSDMARQLNPIRDQLKQIKKGATVKDGSASAPGSQPTGNASNTWWVAFVAILVAIVAVVLAMKP